MRLYITRDSVAAGDDVHAPHTRVGSFAGNDVPQIVSACIAISPLPSVAGGNATWAISSGLPLAVIAQQWSEPKMLSQLPPKLDRLDFDGDELRLHFTYFAQQPPDLVFTILQRLRLHAR